MRRNRFYPEISSALRWGLTICAAATAMAIVTCFAQLPEYPSAVWDDDRGHVDYRDDSGNSFFDLPEWDGIYLWGNGIDHPFGDQIHGLLLDDAPFYSGFYGGGLLDTHVVNWDASRLSFADPINQKGNIDFRGLFFLETAGGILPLDDGFSLLPGPIFERPILRRELQIGEVASPEMLSRSLFRSFRFLTSNLEEVIVSNAGSNSPRVTGSPINSVSYPATESLILLIHGWNPNPEAANFENFRELSIAQDAFLRANDPDGRWDLLRYNWSEDADTGGNPKLWQSDDPSWLEKSSEHGTRAALGGYLHGVFLGKLLAAKYPNLERIQLIAHSAGSWTARNAAYVLARNTNVETIQVTLLDAYMPAQNPLHPGEIESRVVLGTGLMRPDQWVSAADFISGKTSYDSSVTRSRLILEHYFATGLTGGTESSIPNFHVNRDITAQIPKNFLASDHSKPIDWYSRTTESRLVDEEISGYRGHLDPIDPGDGDDDLPWRAVDESARSRGFRDSIVFRNLYRPLPAEVTGTVEVDYSGEMDLTLAGTHMRRVNSARLCLPGSPSRSIPLDILSGPGQSSSTRLMLSVPTDQEAILRGWDDGTAAWEIELTVGTFPGFGTGETYPDLAPVKTGAHFIFPAHRPEPVVIEISDADAAEVDGEYLQMEPGSATVIHLPEGDDFLETVAGDVEVILLHENEGEAGASTVAANVQDGAIHFEVEVSGRYSVGGFRDTASGGKTVLANDLVIRGAPDLGGSPNGDLILAAGEDVAMFGRKSGPVWSWGFGEELTHDSWQGTPMQTNGLPVVDDLILGYFGMALDQGGRVWTWGNGWGGRLGHGDMERLALPKPVFLGIWFSGSFGARRCGRSTFTDSGVRHLRCEGGHRERVSLVGFG